MRWMRTLRCGMSSSLCHVFQWFTPPPAAAAAAAVAAAAAAATPAAAAPAAAAAAAVAAAPASIAATASSSSTSPLHQGTTKGLKAERHHSWRMASGMNEAYVKAPQEAGGTTKGNKLRRHRWRVEGKGES